MQLLSDLRQSNTCDKIILDHGGAFGDFLLTWSSIAAIRQFFPNINCYWHGSSSRLAFLKPLDIHPAPACIHQTMRDLFSPDSKRIHDALSSFQQSLVFRFHLDKRPTGLQTNRIISLQGYTPGQSTSPLYAYATQLSALGLDIPRDNREYFHQLFASPTQHGTRTVLLFSGSGHPKKNWPRVQFFSLASRLRVHGFDPLFVVGPVEQEQGVEINEWPYVYCDQVEDLIQLCNSALAVIGGDTGPMHLAGLLQKPTVSLFGPTDPAVFAPIGSEIVSTKAACSPCSQLCRNLTCRRPICMEEISVDMVMEALGRVLSATLQPI